MWNPFKRETDFLSVVPPANEQAVDKSIETKGQQRSSAIATLEMVGTAVVATLTVIELTQDDGVFQLTELLDDLEQTGAKNFVLDVGNVQYMDSSCLGCLVEALNRMASADGGQIALVNADHSVQYLFRMTQLDRVFRICSDVLSALEVIERSS